MEHVHSQQCAASSAFVAATLDAIRLVEANV
jgi:hypothetical protein